MKGKHFQKEAKRKRNAQNKLIQKIIIIVLLCVFLYSSYQVIYWLKSNKELRDLENNIFSEVVQENTVEDETAAESETVKTIDFEKLMQINQDVVAWIIIDNTNINYPVLKGNNNDYYLRRDLYKASNSCGSIFLDCNTKSDFSEQNTVIYGHHLTRGGMFTDLDKIYKGELGEEVYIQIYTKEALNTYQVIASYIATPDLSLVKKSFTETEKQKYLNDAIKKSKIQFKQTPNMEENILTLITCYGKQRTIVNALKIN